MANAVLVAIWVHPSFVPSDFRSHFSGLRLSAPSEEKPQPAVSAVVASAKQAITPSIWSTFVEKNDLKQFVAQLRAAGFPTIPFA